MVFIFKNVGEKSTVFLWLLKSLKILQIIGLLIT